jgi:hypothetical protein
MGYNVNRFKEAMDEHELAGPLDDIDRDADSARARRDKAHQDASDAIKVGDEAAYELHTRRWNVWRVATDALDALSLSTYHTMQDDVIDGMADEAEREEDAARDVAVDAASDLGATAFLGALERGSR